MDNKSLNYPFVQPNQSAAQADIRLRFGLAILALGAFFLIFMLSMKASSLLWPSKEGQYGRIDGVRPIYLRVKSRQDLVGLLQKHGIWEVNSHALVPPIVLDKFPARSPEFSLDRKKRLFLHSMLPIALLTKKEVDAERLQFARILRSISLQDPNIDFSEEAPWKKVLPEADLTFLENLVDKYQTNDAEKLLLRVDSVPVCITLAQAALESSWGSSRFAREGNNIFGIWTWSRKGIVPLRREEGKQHKVAIFPSLLDSFRSHTMLLNRMPAYQKFRLLRAQTTDPLVMANGLINYSERRMEYVRDIKRVIRQNNLLIYDTCQIADSTVVN